MGRLPPLFPYYGSKYMLAPRYDHPAHRTIIEPFAGSAQYALLYHDREVVLCDADDKTALIWRYLLSATPADVLDLPIPARDDYFDTVQWPCEGARSLANAHCCIGGSGDRRRTSRQRANFDKGDVQSWCRATLRRIAATIPRIRHWRFIHGDYTACPDVRATWFVDPPYQLKGVHYRESSAKIDFAALGDWCRSRDGQTIVCENHGADWLPFAPLCRIRGTTGNVNTEAVWYGGNRSRPPLFAGEVA